MENYMAVLALEIEKLHGELANADKRARAAVAAAAAANPGDYPLQLLSRLLLILTVVESEFDIACEIHNQSNSQIHIGIM